MKTLKLYSIINFRDQNYPVFESNFIKSIQSGCAIQSAYPHSLQDHVGDNISSQNPLYGELTAHYWVWKNAPKADYIGFCHYRRFFQLKYRWIWQKRNAEYPPISPKELQKKWASHYSNEKIILKLLNQYDIILPSRMRFRQTIAEHYQQNHGDYTWFTHEFYAYFPDLKETFDTFFFKNTLFVPTLLFITSYPTFNHFMTWLFGFLFHLHSTAQAEGRLLQERELAYIAERLFGFYFCYVAKLNILHKKLDLLIPPSHS
jgi:hypothetical protein